ncbi:hypothetical protein [Kordia sp.]|uniref:hypothetical protein n=1 Tax=Kordia sp. TaxID=1965332 RepID=UPI003D6C5773
MHITDILNTKLLQIGSTLRLDKESNEIGKQIAYQGVEDRSMEIIRVREEKEIWVSFQCQGVFLPSLYSSDIEEIINIIFKFLELKISLKYFFNNYNKSPIDISDLIDDKEILLELSWFKFTQPSQTDYMEPKEWLLIKQFSKSIQSIAKTKKLFPDRSMYRLCFYSNKKNNLEDFPCIWVSKKEEPTLFGIGYYNGPQISVGFEKEILIYFEQIIRKIN